MVKLVRVSSISFSGAGRGSSIKETVERNVKAMTSLLERASLDKPHIVCFPEASPMLGLSIKEAIEAAREFGSHLLETFSSLASKFGFYLVCPMMEEKDGLVYNSAIFFSKNGELLGSYYKVHPTISEIEGGITPGKEAKVFDLEFGKVGAAICFDLNFMDVAEGLYRQRARLVFFPSMYPGGLQLSCWAIQYGFYMVSAYTGEGSIIINPLGRILARSDAYNPIICEDINLDYGVFHIDYNHEKWIPMKRKYGHGVRLEVSRPEAIFLLESFIEGITVEQVKEEFQLEPREEYFLRACVVRERALAKLGSRD